MIIEPQGSAEDPFDDYPCVGFTGAGDMRSTAPVAIISLRRGVHEFGHDELVAVERSTYDCLMRALAELDEMRRTYRNRK